MSWQKIYIDLLNIILKEKVIIVCSVHKVHVASKLFFCFEKYRMIVHRARYTRRDVWVTAHVGANRFLICLFEASFEEIPSEVVNGSKDAE